MNEQELVARIDRLERRCKRLTCAAGALALAFVTAITTGAVQEGEVPDVVRAQKFEVVGKDGTDQVAAKLDASGLVLFHLGDRAAWIGATEEGCMLGLRRTSMGVEVAGVDLRPGRLTMFRDGGRDGPTEGGHLSLVTDELGAWLCLVGDLSRASLRALPPGGTLELTDENFATRAFLGCTGVSGRDNPGTSLVLFGPDGEVLTELPLD